jgi:phosphate uptake regulator
MAEHTVKAFDEDITRLRGLIAEMGGLAEVALQEALDALVRGDEELGAKIVARDKKIDALEMEVDKLAVRVIALRAPMADDLREVIAADAKVDAFYDSIFRNLVSHMVENPATTSSAAQLLFIARNIERIGDHATNVAEMVHFAATGVYPPDHDD